MKVKFKGAFLVMLIVSMAALGGCQKAQTADSGAASVPAATGDGDVALDPGMDNVTRLAFGTLMLEGGDDAVTPAQAAKLLPLWTLVQGGTLQSDAETNAVLKQLQGQMTAAQLAAIDAQDLTFEDMQAWMREQGIEFGAPGDAPGDGQGAPGGMPTMTDEERAQMRERFQNMTEEERAAAMAERGAQMPEGMPERSGDGQGWNPGQRGAQRDGNALLESLIALLTERSSQTKKSEVTPAREKVSSTAATMVLAVASPDATPLLRVTLVPLAAPTPVPDAPVEAGIQTATGSGSAESAALVAQTTAQAQPAAQIQGALKQVPDTDPGPPLTIEITTNSVEPNPLLEGGTIYRIGGFVHNPTDETYAVTAVHVTFFNADGFRGAFYAFPPRPGQRGIQGEWVWHGAMEAQISCAVLGSGESCPFTAEIVAQNMASFLVHPDAMVAEWHESVGVTLSDTKIADTGVNYVRISGTATNPNVYPIKNVAISALLLDENGQTVSMGTGVLSSLAAGASTNFEVYVQKKTYASYQLHARAEQVVN